MVAANLHMVARKQVVTVVTVVTTAKAQRIPVTSSDDIGGVGGDNEGPAAARGWTTSSTEVPA